MKRFVLAVLVVAAASGSAVAQGETLPKPKGDWKTSYDAGVAEGDNGKDEHKPKLKHCPACLCKLLVLNATAVKIKTWIRASLIGYEGLVEIPAECHGKSMTICPCDHPWHEWFDKIYLAVWDGQQSTWIEIPFYDSACKRRFVIEYVNVEGKLKLKLVEK